jgi:hypothetical protein
MCHYFQSWDWRSLLKDKKVKDISIAEILLKVASNTKKLNQNQINIEKLLHIMKLTFKHIAEFALIKLFFVCLAFRFFKQ